LVAVTEGVDELLDQCPELFDAFQVTTQRRTTLLERLLGWYRAKFRKPYEVRI
jgi:hypothetical protein